MKPQYIIEQTNYLLDDELTEALISSINRTNNGGGELDVVTLSHKKDLLVFDLHKGDEHGITAQRRQYESLASIFDRRDNTQLVLNYEMVFKILGVEHSESKGYVQVVLITQLGQGGESRFKQWASTQSETQKYAHIHASEIVTITPD